MTVRLSICLPVYNFGAFLGETLDSIMPQATPGVVEVIVVDGASTDDTADVVARRAARWPNVRHVLLERRGGIDVDMARSVEQAKGEYCWLFSGDDIMRPGAVDRVLASLGGGDDVVMCRHTICDKDMRFLADYPVLRSSGPRRLDFADAAQRQAFLQDGVNTECLFSFMSGLVIRCETWRSMPAVDSFTGSCWGHTARLLALARTRLRVFYTDELWLDKRGENDSFMDRGVVYRIHIAVDGFLRLAHTYWGEGSVEEAQVRRFLRNEFTIVSFMAARKAVRRNPSLESRAELDRFVDTLYGGRGPMDLVTQAVYRGFPLWLYAALRAVAVKVRPWVARRGFIMMR
ncbi:glycosyltransferase family 2 protein [Caenimonas aquaedulcis]|uniref:Glycosyltransferase family 2 protein n=1 Tax=Caenimonas aquaedulcis TaxID=2793270 RepID=A0A931H5D0_9BURK|nr:glycosyltransferase family A protein [Caenimonas aquaedulcis]MBG9388886.1 glycosyltransferase family 2 protein [Caenimonas aquaedulcis]